MGEAHLHAVKGIVIATYLNLIASPFRGDQRNQDGHGRRRQCVRLPKLPDAKQPRCGRIEPRVVKKEHLAGCGCALCEVGKKGPPSPRKKWMIGHC